jgi:hypothetical protein
LRSSTHILLKSDSARSIAEAVNGTKNGSTHILVNRQREREITGSKWKIMEQMRTALTSWWVEMEQEQGQRAANIVNNDCHSQASEKREIGQESRHDK